MYAPKQYTDATSRMALKGTLIRSDEGLTPSYLVALAKLLYQLFLLKKNCLVTGKKFRIAFMANVRFALILSGKRSAQMRMVQNNSGL